MPYVGLKMLTWNIPGPFASFGSLWSVARLSHTPTSSCSGALVSCFLLALCSTRLLCCRRLKPLMRERGQGKVCCDSMYCAGGCCLLLFCYCLLLLLLCLVRTELRSSGARFFLSILAVTLSQDKPVINIGTKTKTGTGKTESKISCAVFVCDN